MEWSDFPLSYMMLAHGHVVPRDDKIVARCGGPALCDQCKLERLYLQLLDNYRKESRKRLNFENQPTRDELEQACLDSMRQSSGMEPKRSE